MKKTLILFMVIIFAGPVYADIVNPNLTQEQRAIISQQRYLQYMKRTRLSVLNRVCGDENGYLDDKEIVKCKAALKKDYEENLKFLDAYVKERKKDVNKNFKNASK